MDREPRQYIAAEVRAEAARQRARQEKLADILGLTQQAVSLKMNGERAFTADEIAALADFFGVPATQFFPETARAGAS